MERFRDVGIFPFLSTKFIELYLLVGDTIGEHAGKVAEKMYLNHHAAAAAAA
jgi:hypothetical protein